MSRFHLWVIRAAAWLVPRPVRASWRKEWMSESWHYAVLLEERRTPDREMAGLLRDHAWGALADAWEMRTGGTLPARLRSALRRPSFVILVECLCLLLVIASSHGLVSTRSMIAPPYPDSGRIVLISESGLILGQRLAISTHLLDYWKTRTKTLDGVAGYNFDSNGTAWVTPEFFRVLGTRPDRFLLRRIGNWRTGGGQFGVIGRLKPGVEPAAVQKELRRLAYQFRHGRFFYPFPEAQVVPLETRLREPLYTYATIAAVPAGILLMAALAGLLADRRARRMRPSYWAYFCAKAVGMPVILLLAVLEFSAASAITVPGGTNLFAEPFSTWLFVMACGGIVWGCLADQQARCRACLQLLEYPVRIGSLGAILFDPAGMEMVCCQGHGALYVPEASSDYFQVGGWNALDTVVKGG